MPRPSLSDLMAIAREALPCRPSWRRVREGAVTSIVRGVALGLAVAALPGVGLAGDGRPAWGDVALAAGLVGGFGAAWAPAWRRLVGATRLVPLAATVAVLDAALLRVVDVLLGPGLDTDGGPELLAAAVVLAIPTAVLAVVRDVLAKPDAVALPD
jgi:hypothetical protein